MKRFSDFNKNQKASKKAVDNNNDIDNELDYQTLVNREILAQEKPNKQSNTQSNIQTTKEEIPTKNPLLEPNDVSTIHDKDYKPSTGIVNLDENKVNIYGRVATFPKGTNASNAITFSENVKLSKNRIWYVLVEKQDDELQMVKYNMKKGINLSSFVNELKKYYINFYKNDKEIVRLIENIKLGGDKEGNFSAIKNIPNIDLEGKKAITKITEDLIKILSSSEK